ncbi:hypothetical protein DBR22_09790 [Arthrobacter sp. HMWF013]|nr:hypothetical protein DBR22_09790 [Arthrobacter sp. HMWF013]
MDPFAWMKTTPNESPAAASTIAVADPMSIRPEPVQQFMYNPWKLKDLRRLYVNLHPTAQRSATWT